MCVRGGPPGLSQSKGERKSAGLAPPVAGGICWNSALLDRIHPKTLPFRRSLPQVEQRMWRQPRRCPVPASSFRGQFGMIACGHPAVLPFRWSLLQVESRKWRQPRMRPVPASSFHVLSLDSVPSPWGATVFSWVTGCPVSFTCPPWSGGREGGRSWHGDRPMKGLRFPQYLSIRPGGP